MWLLKDLTLTLGSLLMAALFVVGAIGYAFDLRDLRTETIKWGLTWNDLLFIVFACAFLVVTVRLIFRLRAAESRSHPPIDSVIGEDAPLETIRALIAEGQELQARCVMQGTALPEAAAANWGQRVEEALTRLLGDGYANKWQLDFFSGNSTQRFTGIALSNQISLWRSVTKGIEELEEIAKGF